MAERGEYCYAWNNLLDLRLAKSVTVGTSLGRPSAIIMGRLVRIGGRISF